jgi:hypothetical protein
MNTIAALDVAGAVCLLCGLTLGAVIVIELAWSRRNRWRG